MGFPLRDKITGGYPIIMKFRRMENTFQARSKSHIFSLRMGLPFRFILNFSECSQHWVLYMLPNHQIETFRYKTLKLV